MSRMPSSQALARANEYFANAQFQEAEAICRSLVAGAPGEPEAFKLLGAIAYVTGRHLEAAELMARAAELAPDVPEYQNNLSVAYAAIGRCEEAEAAARRALTINPQFAEAESNLANALNGAGRPAEAEAAARRALALRPAFYEALNNLGDALHAQGRDDEAERAYSRAIEINPRNAGGYVNLGVLLQTRGRWEEAEEAYQAALAINPSQADARANLAALYLEVEEFEEAEAEARRALKCNPLHYRAAATLARAIRAQGRFAEAVDAYRQVLGAVPDWPELHRELGEVLDSQGRQADAELAYRQALVLQPENLAAQLALAGNLVRQWRLAEAEAACRQAVRIEPKAPQAHCQLASVLLNAGRMAEAVQVLRQGLEAAPEHAALLDCLAQALRDQGQIEAALVEYRRAVDRHPELPELHSGYLHSMLYDPKATEPGLLEAHAAWDNVHAAPLRAEWQTLQTPRDPDRPLRLGFVSPDFNLHPVGCFLASVLGDLSLQGCPTVCYWCGGREDFVTAQVRVAAGTWRAVAALSDEQLAEQIRADRVDVLFDLTGHGPLGRPGVFARKPAPLQVAWIGYRGTTGLAAIDYLVADAVLVPEGHEQYYREQILRLPETAVAFGLHEAPEVGPLPAVGSGHVTFASFNSPAKINPQQIAAWAEILRRVPGSRLALRYRGLDDPGTAGPLVEAFQAEGIASDRLELTGLSPRRDVLAAYNRVDVALDTLAHNGSLTTCEALWMGVPVVACPGQTFSGRLAASHLTAAGLAELVAESPAGYIDLAVALAGVPDRLAALRAGLRGRVARSPLCDAAGLAKHLTQRLREAWRRWCQTDRG